MQSCAGGVVAAVRPCPSRAVLTAVPSLSMQLPFRSVRVAALLTCRLSCRCVERRERGEEAGGPGMPECPLCPVVLCLGTGLSETVVLGMGCGRLARVLVTEGQKLLCAGCRWVPLGVCCVFSNATVL